MTSAFKRRAVDQLLRLGEHADDAVVERVHLGVELEAEHAVAEVPQARRAVLRHRLAGALDVGEQQHALGPPHVDVAAASPRPHRELLQLAALDAVEGAVADRREQRRHRAPFAPSRGANYAGPSRSMSSNGPHSQL